ncbi:transposase family protein [Ectothiorhodospiraceae bacterium WFHF3C12]|nr:transposase family protein [Ectothiorhodospiraceae bacterium WFHF3C12]
MTGSTVLTLRIREIVAVQPHYVVDPVTVLLRHEGWPANQKCIHRLCCAEGFTLRHRVPRRHRSARRRQPQRQARSVNRIWSMEFASDALYDGRRLRALTVVDQYTRACLAIRVNQNLHGKDVAAVTDILAAERSVPEAIKADNGAEFVGKVIDRWAHENGVEIDFPDAARRRITPRSSVSMAEYARSALTRIGSSP